MCGINGVFHYAVGVADAALLERQALAQKHRGPDDSGGVMSALEAPAR